MSSVKIDNVHKTFGNHRAVAGFSLEIGQGEFVSFLGGSGCGKTTTLRMVAGFETPDQGTIFIGDQDVSQLPPNKRNVGMVFQNYALFPNMTVAHNIAFGLKTKGIKAKQIKTRVGEMLELIHMESMAGRYPWQLSGGQQQRVALARALAPEPRVLLLDEPLSALDAKIRTWLGNEIRSIQQKMGITTIYVTHDQEEALALSDRVVVMNEGKIEQAGTPFEIYNSPQSAFVASFIGTLNHIEVVHSGQGWVDLGGQRFDTGRVLTAAVGEKLKISLRPERLSLVSPGTPVLGNTLHGQLNSVQFLGSVVRLGILVGQQEIFLDSFNTPHLNLPQKNGQIHFCFAPQDCLVLDGQP